MRKIPSFLSRIPTQLGIVGTHHLFRQVNSFVAVKLRRRWRWHGGGFCKIHLTIPTYLLQKRNPLVYFY